MLPIAPRTIPILSCNDPISNSPSAGDADRNASLSALLMLEDAKFVEAAYLRILNRLPDEDGRINYLRLLRGGMPKVQILAALRHSSEGRTLGAKIPGLHQRLLFSRLATIPILRLLITPLIEIIQSASIRKQQRVAIGKLFSDMELIRRESMRAFSLVDGSFREFGNCLEDLVAYSAELKVLLERTNQMVAALREGIEDRVTRGELASKLDSLEPALQALRDSLGMLNSKRHEQMGIHQSKPEEGTLAVVESKELAATRFESDAREELSKLEFNTTMSQIETGSRLKHKDYRFRAPTDLAVSPLVVERALIIGSCTSEAISYYIHRVLPGAKADHILYNFAGEMPKAPPHPVAEYDFQVIMLPLRTVMPETMFFGLTYDDVGGYSEAFESAAQRLAQLLNGGLAYHAAHSITTFVANFLVPQQNSMGRLLPKNDLRNPSFFVRRLNDIVAEHVAALPNAYLLDIDELSATFGRRAIQDDILAVNSHGSFASNWDHSHDQARLHPPDTLDAYYNLNTEEFILALWQEVAAMYRTLKQLDTIKIVIVDLDDTLWRGVISEEGTDNPTLLEGWPLGLTEALTTLKRRGVLLAIVSKNDEATITRLWSRTIGNRLPLNRFAVVKINWEPKANNIAAVLSATNLLPRNALFIDDNPVERESVKAAYPDIRTLGADLYYIRRILLWSPELQVAMITNESGRRTEMIQAQEKRDQAREAMPRKDFLASLAIKIQRISISDTQHERFARCLELINKSNQFNTTGQRRTLEQLRQAFAEGGRLEAFEVSDRFTQYGLVVVVFIQGNWIEQFVMSCRVVGLDVEIAVLALIGKHLFDGNEVSARIIETDANFLCRDLYQRCGFTKTNDYWTASGDSLPSMPPHVEVE